MRLSFEYGISIKLIEVVNALENLNNLAMEEVGYLLQYIEEEIKGGIFYSLFYTGDVYFLEDEEIYVDDEKEFEKKENLKKFKKILLNLEEAKIKQLEEKIYFILRNIEIHIENPRLNSDDAKNY